VASSARRRAYKPRPRLLQSALGHMINTSVGQAGGERASHLHSGRGRRLPEEEEAQAEQVGSGRQAGAGFL
jgi:hypothetical protein